MIAVTPDGQRSMNTYLGACREMTPEDVDVGEVSAAKILYIEGYLWDTDSAKEASRKAMRVAKDAGGTDRLVPVRQFLRRAIPR